MFVRAARICARATSRLPRGTAHRSGAARRARVGRCGDAFRCIDGRASPCSATGDELVDVDGFDAVRRGERIVSSNSYTLMAAVRAAGAEPCWISGSSRTIPPRTEERLRARQGCDLLVTSGGVSVGAYDFTKDVLRDARRDLRSVARAHAPRRAAWLRHARRHAVVGFPRQPCFGDGDVRAVRAPADPDAARETARFPSAIDVRTREAITHRCAADAFLARRSSSGMRAVPTARLTGPQGSGLLTSMARANALLVVPPTADRGARRDSPRSAARRGGIRVGDARHLTR